MFGHLLHQKYFQIALLIDSKDKKKKYETKKEINKKKYIYI